MMHGGMRCYEWFSKERDRERRGRDREREREREEEGGDGENGKLLTPVNLAEWSICIHCTILSTFL